MFSNKLILIAVVSFVLFSCKAQKTIIPVEAQEESTTVIQPPKSPPKPIGEIKLSGKTETKEIRIAFLLPLNLEDNFENDTAAESIIQPQSLTALSFYEGALLAKDSLLAKGIKLLFSVIDIGEDTSAKKVLLLNLQALKLSNLVVGNFIQSQCSIAAAVAEQHNLNLVITQHGQSSIVENNPYVALAMPSTYTQCRLMSKFCFDNYKDDKMIIISRQQKRENELAVVFKSELDNLFGNSQTLLVNKIDTSAKTLTSYLDTTKNNLIIIPSSDESYVSSYLSAFDKLKLKIKVVGLPTWENFETIQLGRFENVQVMIFSSTWLDFENERIKPLRRKFIEAYKTDVTFQSYLGFELTMLMAETINASDKNFLENIPLASFDSQMFRFSKFPDGGYENFKFSVLWFKNYDLIKINK